MKDNNILANAICEFVKRSKKKGLVEIPLPTGFGKTPYGAVQFFRG